MIHLIFSSPLRKRPEQPHTPRCFKRQRTTDSSLHGYFAGRPYFITFGPPGIIRDMTKSTYQPTFPTYVSSLLTFPPTYLLVEPTAQVEMKPWLSPVSRAALRRASRNRSSHSATSLTSISLRPLTLARMLCVESARIDLNSRGKDQSQFLVCVCVCTHLDGVKSCRQ